MTRYRTPAAFRAALDARMRREAHATGRQIERVIRVYLMHRFIARILGELGDAVTVKGGIALELRLERARSTKDIDVRLNAGIADVLGRMQRACADSSPLDHLSFLVETAPDDPDIDGDGVIYEGFRYRAQALFAGKRYGGAFGVDVAFGDPMTGARDGVNAPNLLDIVDAPPLVVPLYPIATHLAEKLHAYTLPRERTNHRLKDLVDIALVAAEMSIDGAGLRRALDQTFRFRASHPLVGAVPPPPDEWRVRYPTEQRANLLPWTTLDEVHAAAARFFDPVLGDERGVWAPASQTWRTPPALRTAGSPS